MVAAGNLSSGCRGCFSGFEEVATLVADLPPRSQSSLRNTNLGSASRTPACLQSGTDTEFCYRENVGFD